VGKLFWKLLRKIGSPSFVHHITSHVLIFIKLINLILNLMLKVLKFWQILTTKNTKLIEFTLGKKKIPISLSKNQEVLPEVKNTNH
jgi:hypothetical protein